MSNTQSIADRAEAVQRGLLTWLGDPAVNSIVSDVLKFVGHAEATSEGRAFINGEVMQATDFLSGHGLIHVHKAIGLTGIPPSITPAGRDFLTRTRGSATNCAEAHR